MGTNKMAMNTQPCQYRREPAGMKRIAATKMTAMTLRRMSRVLRLRGVAIGCDVTENGKERVAESSKSNSLYARDEQHAQLVLLESRRDGRGRTITIWRGRRRRSIGVALSAGERAMAPRFGARSWRGDEPPIYGKAGGRIGRRGRSDASIPVSVHGAAAAGSRPADSSDDNRCGCSTSSRGGGSWLAVVGGRQVHGRTHDFASGGTACSGWRAGIGILWLSAAPAQAARNETSGPSRKSYSADAVPARNAG